jgi:predicted GIY-YIG superfamily endonuclease
VYVGKNRKIKRNSKILCEIGETRVQTTKETEQILITGYNKKSVVYLIKLSNTLYKFGLTNNIKKRMSEHRRLMKQEITLIFCIESKNNVELENKLKAHLKENNIVKRISMKINNKEYTELIEISDNYDINNITRVLINYNNTIGESIEVKQEILCTEKNIKLNEQKNELSYIQELETKLKETNDKNKELLLRFRSIETNIDEDLLFPRELYNKFVDDHCELHSDFRCSGKELMLKFKEMLQNTIYQSQINSMYDIHKFTNTTWNFLPKFKREFAKYFETLLNTKLIGVCSRNKESFTRINVPGFSGIRIKGIDDKIYDNSVYIDFFHKTFIKDSYEHKIKTIKIEELFIKYLKKNNIAQLFKYKTVEFSKFKKEINHSISSYFDIEEQRLSFSDRKSARPGFHWLKVNDA